MKARGFLGRRRRLPTFSNWPTATAPARYLGITAIGEYGLATGWDTPTGTVTVVWPCLGYTGPVSHRLTGPASRLADVVLLVRADHGLSGPHLDALDDGGSIGEEVEWEDLARVLGQPAPYWTSALRTREVMGAWQPGAAPVTSLVQTEPDTGPLHQLAASMSPDSPTHRTLTNLADTVRWLYADAAQHDLDLLAEYEPATLVIAARPEPTPEVHVEDLDTTTRRAGWLDVLSRTGSAAADCVRAALMYSSGADMPYGNPVEVDPADPVAREWVARLVPTERTAAFVLLDPDGDGEPLIDPLTDAPAVLIRGRYDGDQIKTAVPQRLPTTSPLATVQLSNHRVWVRTDDSTLWLAPSDSTYGLTWGYNGTGPRTLAMLLARLLNDITAPGPSIGDGAPPSGLADLTRQKWPDGTTLTRAQLVNARDGEPT